MPCQALLRALALGVFLMTAPAQASPDEIAECLPRLAQANADWPVCVPAEGAEEHALVTLQRARAWVRSEQFAVAAESLAESLGSLEGSANVGLVVRVHSVYGEALLGQARFSEAEAALRTALGLWSSENALSWIRTLPSGEGGQRSVQLASDAAARAVLRLAESRLRHLEVKLPRFPAASSPQPFAPRTDLELLPTERAVRSAWAQRQRAAFVRYLHERVAPWLARQRAAIEEAEREFEQVYLVPPVAAPEWRVAVAANIGSLWGRFTDWQQALDASCGVACDEWRTAYYGTLDDPWEPDRRRARAAFDACLALSRKYRLLTEYTLVCEGWLARNFRSDYSSQEELMPVAHWGAR
jgi:tetratricopeptide (TPR) repeat protein